MASAAAPAGGGAGGAAQPAATVNVLIIVGADDQPLYEADLSSAGRRDDSPHLDQFIVNAALDLVEDIVWTTSSMFLRVVDKSHNFNVSAFCTAGHVRFMLLHQERTEEVTIRGFFSELHDLYIKAVMSPFCKPGVDRLSSAAFDQKVRLAARKYFRTAS
eukprot:TRINITY_DN30031_c0_g1_i1.p2 TRINITY_DN30031_c0_g1~~TRINITY_DN30031_c0_g1_i1.p2  ORF type:complete len:160 (+),score=34.98 TRINITY_DN30031_c0_g1_i1:64-543(+)